MGKFTEKLIKKKADANKRDVSLVIPLLQATNGRIILQAISRPKFITKLSTGILLPSGATPESTDTRDSKNPDKEKEYFVVAWAPEVPEQLRVNKRLLIPESGNPNDVIPEADEIQIGDRAIVSDIFQAIKYDEGGRESYRILHWQDLLGLAKEDNEYK